MLLCKHQSINQSIRKSIIHLTHSPGQELGHASQPDTVSKCIHSLRLSVDHGRSSSIRQSTINQRELRGKARARLVYTRLKLEMTNSPNTAGTSLMRGFFLSLSSRFLALFAFSLSSSIFLSSSSSILRRFLASRNAARESRAVGEGLLLLVCGPFNAPEASSLAEDSGRMRTSSDVGETADALLKAELEPVTEPAAASLSARVEDRVSLGVGEVIVNVSDSVELVFSLILRTVGRLPEDTV